MSEGVESFLPSVHQLMALKWLPAYRHLCLTVTLISKNVRLDLS